MSRSQFLRYVGLAVLVFVVGCFARTTTQVSESKRNQLDASLTGQAQLDESRSLLDFSNEIRRNPDSYDAYAGRAKVHAKRGNYTQARRDIDVALSFEVPAGDRRRLLEISEFIESRSQVAHSDHQQRAFN